MEIHNQQWPWFAILARTSREKTASLVLESAGYECFLPTSKCTRRWSDRTKEIEVPLFPGYFFCRMNPLNRLPVLMTPGVIQIVGIGKNTDSRRGRGNRGHPARGKETLLRQCLGRTCKSAMSLGSRMALCGGMTGIVIKIKSGLKLVLSVNLLQRSVAVEIDRSWISAAYPVRPLQSDRVQVFNLLSITGLFPC